MAISSNSRRQFLKVGSAALAATAVSWNARSYAAILGANDRVRVGVVGCGDRMKRALLPAFLQHSKELNFEFVAVSNIWNRRREEGEAAWGTRGRWCSLTGHTGGHTATVAIFDQPKNPGYPTYWHARGYGLFAVNPLAPSIFDPKQPALNLTLDKGQSVTFRYRVMLYSRTAAPDELNRESDAFLAEAK
jgi:hypothetical protein